MVTSVKKIFEEIIQTDHKVITEETSKSILKTYGVKVPPYALATSADDAVKQAKKIGFPLVINSLKNCLKMYWFCLLMEDLLLVRIKDCML